MTMRKTIILTIACMCLAVGAYAQRGSGRLSLGAGLLYKKRGVGMFVASGAREKLRQSRRERFYQDYVQRMVREARNLGLTDQELLELLERGMKEDGH